MKIKFECARLKAQKNSKHDFDKILTNEILSDIAFLISGKKDYSIDWVEKTNKGRILIGLYNDKKYYINLSQYGMVESRNNYLQSVPTAYEQYFNDDTNNKEFVYYCLPYTGNNKTPYIKFGYKLMKTAGIRFLNESYMLNKQILEPFNSMKELINTKREMRKYNPSNKSSYITDEGDCYNIYGKTFGANGKETSLTCYAISRLADKPVNLYPIIDNETTKLSDKTINTIQQMGKITVLYDTFTMELSSDKPVSEDIRSAKFIYNLLCKYGDKHCALCDCQIDSLIQAAHIWPVSDIKKTNLSFNDKKDKASDAENGIWLCENHHKLFDCNLLTINQETGDIILSDTLAENGINFINYITTLKQITLSSKMKEYFMLRYNVV